jgi:hypothetical protein
MELGIFTAVNLASDLNEVLSMHAVKLLCV